MRNIGQRLHSLEVGRRHRGMLATVAAHRRHLRHAVVNRTSLLEELCTDQQTLELRQCFHHRLSTSGLSLALLTTFASALTMSSCWAFLPRTRDWLSSASGLMMLPPAASQTHCSLLSLTSSWFRRDPADTFIPVNILLACTNVLQHLMVPQNAGKKQIFAAAGLIAPKI